VPTNASSFVTGARDEWRRRPCDLRDLAHSETAGAVRVRILVRVASSVMHQSPGNVSDPKTPPVRGLSKVTAHSFSDEREDRPGA
jgi:hypothetical protein